MKKPVKRYDFKINIHFYVTASPQHWLWFL